MAHSHSSFEIVTQKVILKSDSDHQSEGTVKILYFSQKQRVIRSLKVLGLAWGAAVLAIFLPIIHFVLVPTLILAGLIVPGFIYLRESLILGGESTCPKCHVAFHIEKGSNQWPLSDLCTECRTSIIIEKII